MKKILITAPLRQDADIFEAYQTGLDRLEVPEGFEVSRFFVVYTSSARQIWSIPAAENCA